MMEGLLLDSDSQNIHNGIEQTPTQSFHRAHLKSFNEIRSTRNK